MTLLAAFLSQFYLANDNGTLNGLECTISGFHAWNAELSATEVQADYAAACYEIRVVTGSIRYWFPNARLCDRPD